MEFGVLISGYVGDRRQDDPHAEHHVIMEDLELVEAADKAGFKYAWVTEHHFLDEYSHLSASDVVLGYLAKATERIHIGSGIFNPLPTVNHPAKVAERVAMLDHLSDGRFEFGTGRGAGSHEILAFLPGVSDLSSTRAIWEETIGEFQKMWLQETYEGFDGEYWSLPPRSVLPKPWKRPHPAMWYAAGNVSSYEMAARKGLGVLGFSVGDLSQMDPVLKAYKGAIVNAEPVGAYANDNIMVASAAFVSENPEKARRSAINGGLMRQTSNVYRYHDTFPRPEGIPPWPEVLPDLTPEAIDAMVEVGSLICGSPDDALRGCQRWASAGADQLVFATGLATRDEVLETIRLLGEHVIPRVDIDPVHRTTRFREAAANRA